MSVLSKVLQNASVEKCVKEARSRSGSGVHDDPAGEDHKVHRFETQGEELGIPFIRMHELLSLIPAFDILSFTECARRRCAVFGESASASPTSIFVVCDPLDTDTMAWALTRFRFQKVLIASQETFDAWLSHCESRLTALASVGSGPTEEASHRPVGGPGVEVISLRRLGENLTVRFINSTVYDALRAGASDVHLESDQSGMSVKFRLDGVLTSIRRVDEPALVIQAVNRIKVLAQLDIAERRIPQDGRLQFSVDGRTIDVRVSIMPSIHGEDAVLRILDRQHLAESLSGLTLGNLGYDETTAHAFRKLCQKSHGMVLVTGPTGSGKTTTLYAAISETRQARDKIITIEDPVEYQLPGVLQIPVNERKGLTFAKGLRSILRHDPDRILVGEIRDAETAQIAVQSALTGHLVFTTVHANTALDVVSRFEQLGIDPYTFASSINGILAQRLFRKLCRICAIPAEGKPELYRNPNGYHGRPDPSHTTFEAVGCEHCRGTGYSGRFAVGELLTLTPALKALISSRAPHMAIEEEARRSGWRRIECMAHEAVLSGMTTAKEVERVAS